jgi:hypothetical protein
LNVNTTTGIALLYEGRGGRHEQDERESMERNVLKEEVGGRKKEKKGEREERARTQVQAASEWQA